MSEHTPGAWSVTGDPCHYDSLTSIVAADGSRVAECAGEWPPMEANARLIAAAPDMLAALKVARDCVLESFEYVKTTDDQVLADARLRDIDQAVAKASAVTSANTEGKR